MSLHHRILVADLPEAFGVFRSALAGRYTLVAASTMEQAREALADHPDLVVCGCHFDEARMYDLLRLLKATPGLEHTPFLATRCVPGELLDDTLYESVKIAVRALGGNAFVDLLRWQQRWGAAEASQRLTQLVESLLNAGPADTTQ
jgi:hypothetical protein